MSYDKKYNLLVLVGRFQPLHSAHVEIIKRATALCDRLVIITGSAKQPRTFKNPFTSAERAVMIKDATRGLSIHIHVEENVDTIYNDQAWAVRVQAIVNKHFKVNDKVGIIGHKKDLSSSYLDMFPQWELEEVELIEPLNATDVRDLYFRRDANMNFIRSVVPQTTFDFLEEFRKSSAYEEVVAEREFIANYKKQYASLPYPPVFVTTDALVVCSGHILLVERKAFPGKGLFALPGGFLNPNERITQGAIRELKEETKIKVPVPVLEGSIKEVRVFDHPDRSARGRTITHCFLIELPDGELPKVKGSDDAKTAQWIPISQVDSSMMFEDHAQMIQEMIGV
jgi:bifunctional NMN adenylyltransferase/nudix hydrolase